MEGIHVRNVQQAADVVSPALSIQNNVVLVGAEVLLRVDLVLFDGGATLLTCWAGQPESDISNTASVGLSRRHWA